MSYKKFLLICFLLILIFLFFIMIINFIIDPFEQYRKARFHKTLYTNEFYLNSGLIKNYDYDSISVGSSMTQNFKNSNIENILKFEKSIKFPIPSGNIYEHITVVNSALKTKKVKNILFGLDIFSLKDDNNRLPIYLYDNNIYNDYLYLMNIDTLKRSFIYPFLSLFISEQHPRFNYDIMFQWQHHYKNKDFNETKVLKNFYNNSIDLGADENQNILLKERKRNIDKYIIPMIEKNLNVNFLFFYPPYSILAYKDMKNNNVLNNYILIKKYIYFKLSKYKNVKLYDFQIAKEVVCNLNNYRDIIHYHQRINTWILKQIVKDNYLVSPLNIDIYLYELNKQVINYNMNKKY